jgi:hypothetical protein
MAHRDGQVTEPQGMEPQGMEPHATVTPSPVEETPRRRLSFRVKFLLAIGLFVGVFAAVGGFSWVYIHLIKDDPPPKLSFDQRDKELAATTIPSGS